MRTQTHATSHSHSHSRRPVYSGSHATEDVRQSRIPSDMSTKISDRPRCASFGNNYDAGGPSESTQEDSFWLRAMQTAESEGKQIGCCSDRSISKFRDALYLIPGLGFRICKVSSTDKSLVW